MWLTSQSTVALQIDKHIYEIKEIRKTEEQKEDEKKKIGWER